MELQIEREKHHVQISLQVNNTLIDSDLEMRCRPLDNIEVGIDGLSQIEEVTVQVFDSDNSKYFERRLCPCKQHATVTFAAKGAPGIQTIRVVTDDTRLVVVEKMFHLDVQLEIRTGKPVFDRMYELVRGFMKHDTISLEYDGKLVTGYRSPDSSLLWLRDHVHQMKAFKHWEKGIIDAVDVFVKTPNPDGGFYDYVDYIAREDSPSDHKFVRIGCEADVEYMAVLGVYEAWQASGDDEWMVSTLGNLEKGLEYSLSHPDRWSEEFQLVKRPFTIDTWDFEYTGIPGEGRHDITSDTNFCIMHGDNSGVYRACCILSRLFQHIGQYDRAAHWKEIANRLKTRMNQICWNGSFYTHQVHIEPIDISGVDEFAQLSLSNPYDMNRGIAEHEQCVQIINEYLRRKDMTDAFAEWFSIDPPFPDNTFYGWATKAGEYVNGGIMPLVGGELAKATFDHGYECYGVDILTRYYEMIASTGESYLWYHRDGRPGRSSEDYPHDRADTLSTDGWGASAMLCALLQGLAGVEDLLCLYREVCLSPRWNAASVKEAYVCVPYGTGKGYLAYSYMLDETQNVLRLRYTGMCTEKVKLHILIPQQSEVDCVIVNGEKTRFEMIVVESSRYVNTDIEQGNGDVLIRFGA
jgi:hypothetical protein